MSDNPLHTFTKEGAPLLAPSGGFAINPVKSWVGCGQCSGRSLLEVTDDAKAVVGYLESEYPWTLDVPEDPAQHPPTPHYVMEWLALDADQALLSGIDTSKSLHFAASALVRRFHGQRQGS